MYNIVLITSGHVAVHENINAPILYMQENLPRTMMPYVFAIYHFLWKISICIFYNDLLFFSRHEWNEYVFEKLISTFGGGGGVVWGMTKKKDEKIGAGLQIVNFSIIFWLMPKLDIILI